MELHASVKQINIIYNEHTIHNMQKKYQSVICTQRHHTMKILYRYKLFIVSQYHNQINLLYTMLSFCVAGQTIY